MSERTKNVAEIRRRIAEKRDLVRFLLAKGVAKEIAEEIGGQTESIAVLQERLAARIRTTGGFSFEKKKVALVGPTGVGKSTALLKLAALYQEKKTGIISLDLEKGAWLEKNAGDIPLYVGEDLQAGLQNMEDREFILIDTGGCVYYESERVDALGHRLAAISDLEIHLILSATAKDIDLYGAIHQFSPLNIESLIFTKLDETLSAGVLVNVSSKAAIPISHIAFGYPLPGKIQVADSQSIARKILADYNHEQFHLLRHLF